jgi:hypothetical protein
LFGFNTSRIVEVGRFSLIRLIEEFKEDVGVALVVVRGVVPEVEEVLGIVSALDVVEGASISVSDRTLPVIYIIA